MFVAMDDLFLFCSSFVREVVARHCHRTSASASPSVPTQKLRKLRKLKIFFFLSGWEIKLQARLFYPLTPSPEQNHYYVVAPEYRELSRTSKIDGALSVCMMTFICCVVACSRHRIFEL